MRIGLFLSIFFTVCAALLEVVRLGIVRRQGLYDVKFVSEMENLSDLPYEMLAEIARRLKKLEDYISFSSVSKSLRAAAKDEYFEGLRLRQQTPYLMLSVIDDGNDDIREIYSLVEGESVISSMNVPIFKGKKYFESLGWLLCIEEDGTMSLLDATFAKQGRFKFSHSKQLILGSHFSSSQKHSRGYLMQF